MTTDRHQITKIRRDIRRRHATVSAIASLTPRVRRITFASPDFADFESASFDDHVKIFFPVDVAGATPPARDFTPRYFDTAQGTLTIDFVLHDGGAASTWAKRAVVGSPLEIAGPRGSMVVADDFDWYLLVGDDTALPAIGRRVEELRPAVPVITVAAIEDAGEQQSFATAADWQPHWIERRTSVDEASALIASLERLPPPDGDGFIWIAAETSVARAVRNYVIERRRHRPEWTKASAYWTRNRSGERDPV